MSTKHVLAFEADPIYGELLRKEVEGRLGTLTIITDANEGLEKAASAQPDLIYICAELPRTSGFSVCYKLRKNQQTRHIPVIITSADATEETIEKHKQLQNLRADEYVQKPFGINVVSGLLDRYLGPYDGSGELVLEEVENERPRTEEMSFEVMAVDEEAVMAIDELEELDELEPAPESEESVDDDLEAFTDRAFDSITDGADRSAAPQREPAPARYSVEPRRSSLIPPRPGEPSGMVEAGIAAEFAELQQTNANLERKVATLERDLIEAKSNKVGGSSGRELLDLREIINKKDHDLLDIKDKANKKEKQLLELHERLTDAERMRADLEDRNLKSDKKIADLEDKIESQAAEKEMLAQRGEDVQARLNRAQEKNVRLDQELNEERAQRKDDQRRAETDKAETISRLNSERESAINNLRSEYEAKAADVARAHATVVEDWERKAFELKGRISSLNTDIEQERTEKAQTNAVLASTRQELAARESDLATRTSELSAAQQSNAALRNDISEKEELIARLNADLVAAHEVLDRNEEMVGKSRQALAIATQLLEQLESIDALSAEIEEMEIV
ncbi:MAG: response regulator [Myxococcota bacterium]|nr:response regulator [Myxococcota bacterium]